MSSEVPYELAQRIDSLCDQFEQAWRVGQRPDIADYLPQIASEYQPALLRQLVALEAELRAAAGEHPRVQEFLDRFPGYESAVEAGFAKFDPHLTPPPEAAGPQPHRPNDDEPVPNRIGPYQVVRKLGQGAFGIVYEVCDPESGKNLATKVLLRRWTVQSEVREQFLEEARKTLHFQHPGIVVVLGVDEDAGRPYIVQEYVPGGNLGEYAAKAQPSHAQVAELMVHIADAVAYIHRQGLYHRDLKPANILIDSAGAPRVADFGLAMSVREGWQQRGRVAGTPGYMSPEQLRREWHLVNASTDIWSLGVIFYELLARERPFSGHTHDQLREEIELREPRGLREIDETIPRELQRICLKCLTKERSQRYPSAADLRDDLQSWRDAPLSRLIGATEADEQELRIQPPGGLRPFTKEHADFFLELLPGPRDREGLPTSISFWKSKIEQLDADDTFRVGVMYGVSGCGKSSLLQAGLLPNLAEHVTAIYLKASADDTEVNLLRQLRKHFLGLAREREEELTLPEATGLLREGDLLPNGHKLLIVLDQFEQWLHARQGEPTSQLIDALRQCDGGRVQALVCVRDGFMVSINRLLRALDSELDTEKNYAMVDLFDKPHARKVLALLGQAYGRLERSLTSEQKLFLERAVEELAQDDGHVVCVRLVVFAEIMKSREWNLPQLEQLGGLQGVGVQFMRDSFEGKSASEMHRHHRPAAVRLLSSLLPGLGLQIKGGQRSLEQLQIATGYQRRPGDFSQLIRILEHDLKLITPVDPTGAELPLEGESPEGCSDASEAHAGVVERSYTLTHDFLVPVVREWVDLTEGETARGRARLRLRRRADAWEAEQKDRQLPSLFEYSNIRALTKPKSWTVPQQTMMRRARRVHGRRSVLALSALLLASWLGFEAFGRVQAGNVLTADSTTLPTVMARLSPWQLWARKYLRNVAEGEANSDDDRRAQLHARLAHASMTGVYDPELLTALCTREIPYLSVIRDVLQPHQDEVVRALWDTLHSAAEREQARFRAGVSLATYTSDSNRWSAADYTFLTGQLVKENPIHQPQLWRDLEPLSKHLISDLETLFANRELPESQQIGAANALAVFARSDGPRLAHLLTTATAAQYEILYPLVSDWPDGTTKAVLADVVAQQPTDDLSEQHRVASGQRRAGAAISLLRLGEVAKSQGAFQIQDDPESLTQFVHRCRERGVRAKEVVNSLRQAKDVHSRFGLLLALGDYPLAEIDTAQREPLVQQLTESYRSDPSSAIHGATSWLLRKWGFAEEVTKVDHTPLPYDETGKREWYVLEVSPRSTDAAGLFSNILGGLQKADQKIYFTFVVFPPGEYVMGSPEGEADRQSNEQLHRVKLTRPLALSTHEVTWEQWMAFEGTKRFAAYEQQFGRKLAAATPAFGINWFEAVTYCRWLTAQAGQAETAQCYDDPQSLPKDAAGNPQQWPVHLERPGFRLPTEAEWEYVCRSGMRTAYGFGNDGSLLTHYGWFLDNSQRWSHAVGELRPNVRGLFDMHGNLFEWTHDWYRDDAGDLAVDPTGVEEGSNRVGRGGGWSNGAANGRSALRLTNDPSYRTYDLGFRLALSPSGASSPAEQGQKEKAKPVGEGTEERSGAATTGP